MNLAVTLLQILAQYGPTVYAAAVELANHPNHTKEDFLALGRAASAEKLTLSSRRRRLGAKHLAGTLGAGAPEVDVPGELVACIAEEPKGMADEIRSAAGLIEHEQWLDFGLLVNRARFLRRLVEDRNSMNGGYWACPACGSHEFTVPIPSLVLTCAGCFEPLMGPDLLAAVRGRKSQPGSCRS